MSRPVQGLATKASPPSLGALTLLLQGLSDRDVTVQTLGQGRPATENAPTQRPVLSSRHLLLPDTDAADNSARWRLQRAAVAHAAAHLLYSPPRQRSVALKPMGLAVVSAIEDARVEALLIRRLPGIRHWFLDFLRRDTDPNGLGFSALIGRMSHALLDETWLDGNHWVNKARSLFAAARQQHGLEDYEALRRLASILANDLGQMRVRFDAQLYAVPAPYRDDNSYLWDHGAKQDAAADALLVQTPVLTAPPGATEADAPPMHPNPTTLRHLYPEWDYRLQRQRPDWCTLLEKPAPRCETAQASTSQTTPPVLLPLVRSRRLSRARRLKRQWEGDDIDLNAAIEVMVERRGNRVPEGRLFQRSGHSERSSSVLVLLDLSESTNDAVGDSPQPLLEVEKQAALLLARSALAGGDRIAIHGFSSNTRAEVNYFRLLDFGAPLDESATQLLQSVRAGYSTRMGAALRHATRCLATEDSDLRAIMLITDGAPSDIDVFDRRYLTEDAHLAVQEARQLGVETYCLAVDSKADDYVKKIFGWRNYRIAETSPQLPVRLAGLYASFTAR